MIEQIKNPSEFLLGWWLNQDGVRYCAVYMNTLPKEMKNELQDSHTDVWDQVDFISDIDRFILSIDEGWAVPSDSFQEFLQEAIEAEISAAESKSEE